MKTLPIDEQMRQSGERAMQEEYRKFVQRGIDQWHEERGEQWQQRDIESSAAEMSHLSNDPTAVL
jgi:hypothetical protein